MARYYRRRYPKAYGTRYRSNRRIKGLYRTSSMYSIKGAARRFIGKYKLRQALSSIAEHKYFENGVTLGPTAGAQLNSTGSLLLITDVAQGAGQTNRIGDKATGTSLEMKYELIFPGLATTNPINTARIIVFIWKDDTVPAVVDILEDPTYPSLSPFNHDKKVKRKILYDKTINQYGLYSAVATQSFADSQRPNVTYSVYIPLGKLKRYCNIYYQSGTTVGVNNIYCLAIADNNGAANTTWSFQSYTRYNFIDM